MPAAGGRPAGRRHAAPYNSWVTHHRQQKYYKKQHTLSKFQRLKRFETQEEASAGDSSLQRALENPEAYEAEYQKRLDLSFGGSLASPAGAGGPPPEPREKRKKKKRQAKGGDATAEGPAPGAAAKAKKGERAKAAKDAEVEAAQPARGSKRKAKKAPAAAAADAAADAGREEAAGQPWKRQRVSKEARGKTGKPHTLSAGRYSKELRAYQEEQDAKERERQRRQDEISERNRARREYNRNRALKGQLQGQRTRSGQPRMQDRLEALTAKLLSEADGRGKGK
uniref:rRNA-processing protein FYV7 n=1 Tax=Alexandrium catenella TaxID=2925 RepID=A0A7S1LQ49_ALECA